MQGKGIGESGFLENPFFDGGQRPFIDLGKLGKKGSVLMGCYLLNPFMMNELPLDLVEVGGNNLGRLLVFVQKDQKAGMTRVVDAFIWHEMIWVACWQGGIPGLDRESILLKGASASTTFSGWPASNKGWPIDCEISEGGSFRMAIATSGDLS